MLADTAYPKLVEHAAAHRALLDEPAAIRSRLGGDGKAPPECDCALLNFLQVVTSDSSHESWEGQVKNWLALALAAAVAAPIVCVGAERNRESTQRRLDAECETARERRLVPERVRLIDDCVREKFLENRKECERYYADYGGQYGRGAPLYYDLPECVRAFEFRESFQP